MISDTLQTTQDGPRYVYPDPATLVVVRIEHTPHTCLRPNDRTHERTKNGHRRDLKNAAYLAMHQALLRCPQIGVDAREGRLRLAYHIYWEAGRKELDGDAALIVTKGASDGIAKALGRDDKDFVFDPVGQSFIGTPQGFMIVTINREEES